MPRSGNTFTWGSIGTWADPSASDSFDITGWNTLRNDLAAELTRSLANDGTGSLSGALKVYDGSVSAPGVTFATETGTGFYRISAGVIGFAIGGVLKYTFKDGAEVDDNDTSLVTSAALSTELATLGAVTPRYASLSVNARTYTGAGSAEVLTSAKIGTTWVAGPASGITGDTTNGTLTVGATGTYEVWLSMNVQFPSTATLKTLGFSLYKNGSVVTSGGASVTELASHGNRHTVAARDYVSITNGQALDVRATGSTGEAFTILNGSWGARRIA